MSGLAKARNLRRESEFRPVHLEHGIVVYTAGAAPNCSAETSRVTNEFDRSDGHATLVNREQRDPVHPLPERARPAMPMHQ